MELQEARKLLLYTKENKKLIAQFLSFFKGKIMSSELQTGNCFYFVKGQGLTS
jgi:hypothetical protein